MTPRDCVCFPRLASMTKADRDEMKAMKIAIGVHATWCPMHVDKTPMYSRAGDALPGYTGTQRRRDEDAERGR